MGLPRVNETLNFTMTIPSSGKKVKYRPYLVKEEKILLQAFESQDTVTCLQAMCDTIAMCLDEKEKVDTMELATFDIEYMFTQLRSRSVGETSTIVVRCKNDECGQANEVEIDLESLSVDTSGIETIIKLNDEVSVELQYPTYKNLLSGKLPTESKDQQNMEDILLLIANSIVSVRTENEHIDCREQSTKEIMSFLESMTASQLQSVATFFENLPVLSKDIEFVCKECKTHNELELKGLSDFF
jgi:hypothetical protein|tara:strand:+ start:1180 stop:1908 length:729 start_codon:yes stop_codon:yes gene_type:complete